MLSGDRILGEKENLPPGFSGSFSLQLGPGHLHAVLPRCRHRAQRDDPVGELDQSAPTDVAGVLAEGADGYLGYVRNQVTEMQTAVAVLDAAIQSGDVDASKLAYIQARPFYERIEPVAESFVLGDRNLDAAIDLRADDVAPTELEGFHRIEYGLWTDAVDRRPRRRVGAARHRRRQPAAADRRARGAAALRPRQRRRRPARRGRRRARSPARRSATPASTCSTWPPTWRVRSRPSPTSRRA